MRKSISVAYQEIDDISLLPEDEQRLAGVAVEMTKNSYAPYSEFHVGAAILLENGKIVKGSNQENGAYPSGLCAERVAVFAASAEYPGVPMTKIAVCASSELADLARPVSPCGACRQVLLEYELLQKSDMKLLLVNTQGKVYIIDKVQDLLPLSFSGAELKKVSR